MKKQNVLSIILIAAGIVMTIISVIVLPETVVTQLSLNKEGATTMPKLVAVAFPALLTIGAGAVSFLTQEAKQKTKALIISAVGIAVFVMMLIVNSIVK